jgi:hypothetical protein
LLQSPLVIDAQKGPHAVVDGMDSIEAGLRQLDRREFAASQAIDKFAGGALKDRHSCTSGFPA